MANDVDCCVKREVSVSVCVRVVEHLTADQEVCGSNPDVPSILNT